MSKFKPPPKKASLPETTPEFTLPPDFDIDRAAASICGRLLADPGTSAADKFKALDRLEEIDKRGRRRAAASAPTQEGDRWDFSGDLEHMTEEQAVEALAGPDHSR